MRVRIPIIGSECGTGRRTPAAGLSSRRPSYPTWRSRLSSVQVRNLTSATNSGRTQCTRLSASGDPKRLVRGGGTSSGIVPMESGCILRHNRSSSPCLAGSGAVRIVVGEQQRAEPRPPPFRIGPADHEGKPNPANSAGFHHSGEVPNGFDNGLILDSLSRMFAVVSGSSRKALSLLGALRLVELIVIAAR